MNSDKLLVTPAEARLGRPIEPVSSVLRPADGIAANSGLMDHWRMLIKHRWTILAVIVITTTLVLVVSLRLTPQYRAEAKLVINRENPEALGFKDVAASGMEDEFDYKVALETQVEILQSDSLALQVIRELKLYQNPRFDKKARPATAEGIAADLNPDLEASLVKTFHNNLSIDSLPRTRMVQVRYMNQDPKLAAEILNSLVHNFVEQNFKAKYESTMQTSDWLSTELVDLQRAVEVSQQKLVEYQKQNEILGLDDKTNIVTEKLDQLNKDLTAAQTERIQKQSAYELTKAGDLQMIPNLAENKIVQGLQEKEADVSAQLAQLTTKFGPSYPKVQELKHQQQQVQASLRAEIDRVAGRLANEYKSALERERLLKTALEQQKQEANKMNESAVQYNILKREYESNRQLYQDLLTRLKEAKVSAGLKSNNIRVVDVARVPAKPARPNIPLNVSLAFVLSMVCGVGLAYVLESLDTTVRGFEDVQNIASLPALASIPKVAAPTMAMKKAAVRGVLSAGASAEASAPPTAITMAQPKSSAAESYRALRTSLLLSSSGAPPKVILVTSALPEEGKTTTSVNTAIVLAQRNSKVLLVDADLRRPRVYAHLGVRPTPGLSNLLAGNEDCASAIVPCPGLSSLQILPAGPTPPYPSELLESKTMAELLKRWRDEYDHIVIDTPPLLSVTDAAALSAITDGVLLVARAGQTSKVALKRGSMLLHRVNARVLGVALNDVDTSIGGGYYHYYHYGYYGGAKANRYYEEDEQEVVN